MHVCVDDATRLAYVEVLDDEKATTAVGFLRRAVAYYRAHGIRVERVMTDNGSCYRATIHALACQTLGIKHLRTRPYRPRTNGKAERFIRTMLGGWAYGAVYGNSTERRAALARLARLLQSPTDHTAPSATNRHYSGWKPSRGTTWLSLTPQLKRVPPGSAGRHPYSPRTARGEVKTAYDRAAMSPRPPKPPTAPDPETRPDVPDPR